MNVRALCIGSCLTGLSKGCSLLRDSAIVVPLAVVIALAGCGGGGGFGSDDDGPVIDPGPDPNARRLTNVPANHGIAPTFEIEVEAGTTERHGNVEISCPPGGATCILAVARSGTITYQMSGGMPSIVPAEMDLADYPDNHGISPMEGIEVRAGQSERIGNVEVSCPPNRLDCVFNVANDGTISYEANGGLPSIVPAQMTLADVPDNHAISSTAEIEVAAGSTERHGNVEVSCPASGPACVLSVERGDQLTYALTGGVPEIRPATMVVTDVPANHGIAASDAIRVDAGDISRVGDVYVSCPRSGEACVLDVGHDGSVAYRLNGGMPTISAIFVTWPLPSATASGSLDAERILHLVYRGRATSSSATNADSHAWERVSRPQPPQADMGDIRLYEWGYWNAPGMSPNIVRLQKRIKVDDNVEFAGNINDRAVYGALDYAVIWVADDGDLEDHPDSDFGAGFYVLEEYMDENFPFADRPSVYNIDARWEGDALAISKDTRSIVPGQSVVTFETVDFEDTDEQYYGYVVAIDLDFNNGYDLPMRALGRVNEVFDHLVIVYSLDCSTPGNCSDNAQIEGGPEVPYYGEAYSVIGQFVGPNGEEVVGEFESETYYGSFGADRVP